MRRAALLGAGAVLAVAAVAATSGEAVAATDGPPMPRFLGRGLWRVFTGLDHRTRIDVHDVSGSDRRVLWPPSWRVCTQHPAEGVDLDGRTTVMIGVVKKGEACPLRVSSSRR
ncbi:hypothetical protein J7E93_30015 [Streptomyces sp. ISL-36]|uniref:hypothetical protein n=1 Tax=Streptomyces sp. ISL-36 TaxID=2819182 RepID=UPI001BE77FD5|nr:hypothetical protein [Streptomyces sp. ISL-36]MBT2444255.1 hypothetical protein [Streptomyces sp. ISL-36]